MALFYAKTFSDVRSLITDGWLWLGILAIVIGLIAARGQEARPPPMAAAAASALVPGLGQVWLGRQRGWWMLAAAVVVAAVALVVEPSVPFALTWLTSIPALVALGAANLVMLVLRAAASIDAWVAARRVDPHDRFVLAGPVFVATIGLIVVPHVFVAAYGVLYAELITNVFSTADPPNADRDRLNVLLVGIDEGPGRTGARADSIILASVDRQDGSAAMFSISRNLSCVPAPPEIRDTPDCYTGMINSLWEAAETQSQLAPGEAGVRATGSTVEQLLDIEIDYVAAVNLQGMVELVDALGGVTVNVPDRVFDGMYPHEDGTVEVIDIPAGPSHLNGHTTLAFIRSRRLTDDYDRIARQQLVLEAVVAEAQGWPLLLHFPGITRAIEDHLLTDVPLSEVPHLVELLANTDPQQTIALCFGPPQWASVDGERVVPRVIAIQHAVRVALSNKPAVAAEILGLDGTRSTCSV